MNHDISHHRLASPDSLRVGDVAALIQTAQELKAADQRGALPPLLRGRNLVVLSDNLAGESACNFHRAAAGLGAQVSRVVAHPDSPRSRDDLHERARMLGRLYQAIECQGMSKEDLALIEDAAGVPVFDHWGDPAHPTRALAKCMTLAEHTGQPLTELVSGLGLATLCALPASLLVAQAQNQGYLLQAMLAFSVG